MELQLNDSLDNLLDEVNREINTDFDKMSIDEIIKNFRFSIYPDDAIKIKFSECILINKYHRLYSADHLQFGECCVLLLNDINSKKIEFGNLLHKFFELNDIPSKVCMKIKGIIPLEDCVFLVFDKISTSYKNKQIENIDLNSKLIILFYLIELAYQCHEKEFGLNDVNPSLILLDSKDSFRFLMPFPEFLKFNQNPDEENDTFQTEHKIERYRSPESVRENKYELIQDIWMIGCLMVEMFSNSEVWEGLSEEEMLSELKKNYAPKIRTDGMPRYTWSIVCECLNPFKDTRITAKELLLEKYVRLMLKLKIQELSKDLEKYWDSPNDISKLNITIVDGGEDPKAIKKCPMHVKNDASIFCAQCYEVICEQCKKTIHVDHSEKGVFFEYLDFVNLARARLHAYKEKFNKFILEANIPKKDTYSKILITNEQGLEILFNAQKIKIEDQFKYFHTLLDELKAIELNNLAKHNEYFKSLLGKIGNNFNLLHQQLEEVQNIVTTREDRFSKFQSLDQIKKEECMKNVPIDENTLNDKKKSIIKYVNTFHKDFPQVERIKRYFELFIEKFKESKTNDLIKVVEKKIETVRKTHADFDFDSYLNLLIIEFDELSIKSSKNYFNATSRDLFITIANTNKLFSYNIDQQKYFITEVDFVGMPITRFPNYSRNLIINGNLLINGGFDEENKATLPYFFFYDRINKTVTRLSDMIYGHSAHSIIFIPPHFVVVVSGSGILKSEKFDMETNTWTELPEINVPRQNCTLFYHNKQYLYAFGGAYWDDVKRSFVYVESLERLDLGSGAILGGKEWEQINISKIGKEFNLRKSVMSVLTYSPNKILLVGGMINYNTYSDECIQFDFEKSEFSLNEDIRIPQKTCFPSKSFMYTNEKAYQLDNDGNVFEFDYKLNAFSLIKENTVIKGTKAG